MTVIASVATYEKRVAHIRPSVRSIREQEGVERVLVMVGSCEVQERARQICQGLEVEVVIVPEIGPGKKHLAAGVGEPAGKTVVTFDDDRIYPPGYAAALLGALGGGDRPVGLLGYRIASPLLHVLEGPCDFLHGEYGWAYRAEWVDPDEVVRLGSRPELFHNDDVYLGWLFAKAGRGCVVSKSRLRSRLAVNVVARRAATASAVKDARKRLRGALQETWLTERDLQIGVPLARPAPELAVDDAPAPVSEPPETIPEVAEDVVASNE